MNIGLNYMIFILCFFLDSLTVFVRSKESAKQGLQLAGFARLTHKIALLGKNKSNQDCSVLLRAW